MNENGDNNQHDFDDERYKHYIAHWQLLYDVERESARTLDKTLVALAGGALGLSITFIKEIAKCPQWTSVLYASWIFFILSLLSTLISFAVTQRAARNERDIIKREFEEDVQSEKKQNLFQRLTIYLNTISIALFIIGATLITVFSGKNL